MAELGTVTRALLATARASVDDRALAQGMCEACVAGLDVDGAAVSVLTMTTARRTLFASDATAMLLEELQFTLNEGICMQAAAGGRPVMVPDLREPVAAARWPAFGAALAERASVGALFAVPLQYGVANLGVLDLYRRSPGALPSAQWQDVQVAVDAAAAMLLALHTDPDGHAAAAGEPEPGWPDVDLVGRAEVHQATGMVLAQMGISAQDALARMRAHAFVTGRLLIDVADDIVARRLWFGFDGEAQHPSWLLRRRVGGKLVGERPHETWQEGATVNAVSTEEYGGSREGRVADAFVSLADTLVDEYDMLDLLDRLVGISVSLLAADAAGIVLADTHDRLTVVAASSDAAQLLEVLQLQSEQGPCLDAYRSGAPVSVPDLSAAAARWPRFVAAVESLSDISSVHALPMRLRGQSIGALNLFHHTAGPLPPADLALGQALADVATIGILQERAIRRAEVVTEQLQTALTSRVIIEQAKGVLAHYGSLSMDVAFDRLRGYARARHYRLTEVARWLVEHDLPPDEVVAAGPRV